MPSAMLIAMAAATLHFDLAPALPVAGRVGVPPGVAYMPGGFGYEPERRAGEFLFSAAVPEGNYQVTVRLGDARRPARTTVKSEQRRLMLHDVATRPGGFATHSFLVNVRTAALPAPPQNAPGGDAVRLNTREAGSYTWDDRLTLEFLGDPAVVAIDIAPAEAPTVYLAGDSTVTDQRAEPGASWGQMLPAMFDGAVAVANHAESGETLKSFLTGLRFDKLLSTMKPGDWLLIQFGHNDQKQQWPQTYADAALTYPAYLKAYIAEVRRRGATAVLVTPPERRNLDDGRVRDTLGTYAAAMRAVARETGIPLIDLQAASITLYQTLGEARAAALFSDGGRDRTHHANAGAWLLARAVAAGIADAVPSLAAHVRPDARRFDPAAPPMAEALAIAPSIARSTRRPAGN